MTTGRGAVLLIDDDPIALRGHARLLSRLGFQVRQTDDPDTAIGVVASGAVDAVLTDVRMPALDGPEVARELRAVDPDVQVLYVSGSPDLEIVALAAAEGTALIEKPVSVPDLVRALELAVARRRARTKEVGRVTLASRFDETMRSLELEYQPIVRACSGELVGWEALARPRGPLRTVIEALDAARRLGRYDVLGRAVRRRAARQWIEGARRERVFVNVHPAELLDDDLFDEGSALASIAPQVVLEVTEMCSLDTIPGLAGRVARLRERGFSLALDDLGAGQAGLGTLLALEPSIAKLDASMVRGIDRSTRGQLVVRRIVELCRELGVEVVGEGIETDAERRCLTDLGCDMLQGFFIGMPAPLG